MTAILEQRLTKFVNRTDEISIFFDILDSGDPPIMVVCGEGGIGKSSLLAKMVHECAVRGLNKAEIDFKKDRNNSYLVIMKKIRVDIGGEYFNPFIDLANFYFNRNYEINIKIEGSITVADHAHIEGSTTGDIAGIIIKDLGSLEPRKDMAIPEEERLARLTDKFIENLAVALRELASENPLVIFLDTVEKMSYDTSKWVWDELIDAVLDGRLQNIRIVLCGREEPPEYLEREVKKMLKMINLEPLAHEHIIEYLEKECIDENDRLTLANMIMSQSKGNPLKVGTIVDTYIEWIKNKAGDNG